MSDKKRILIVGGGYAGVWAGKILEKRFRKRNDVEITLVDKQPYHTLMTELHEVAGWRTEPESVKVSFRKIFGTKRISCVMDAITGIDFAGKTAKSDKAVYPFDYLILGTGAEPEYFGIPGVKEHSFTLWSFDDAMRIRIHVAECFEKASRETDPAKRRRLLTFVVAGAGFTGMELIGELLEYRVTMCRRYDLDVADTRVVNIEALPSILPILEPPLRERATRYVERNGCELLLDSPISGADERGVLLKDGRVVETETFIWTCGVKGSAFASALPLAKAERSRGRIPTDSGMRSLDYPYVFVAGDGAFFLEGGKPLPQIVEGAHQTAEVAAANIIAEIDGGAKHEFKSSFHGFMISLGGRYGVANAGGMKTRGFVAMAMKHLINCWYLFNIAGFNQVWEYLKHEFLDLEERRSCIGGFFAHKVRAYWTLPLRLWLGLMWVVEGVNKIGEGWFAWDAGSKSGWMFSGNVVQAGVKVVEAVSAASEEGGDATAAPVAAAAAQAADAVSAATGEVVDAVGQAVTQATDAVARTFHKVWDVTLPIFDPSGAVATWFRQTFMDGVFAHLPFQAFQAMIVVMEIGVGLALFGGFFTWFGAVAGIGMCVVFTLSGMFRWEQLFFVFASIVMMGGAGRAFGLDYWNVRFWKRRWNGTRLARRSHLYADEPTK